MQLSVELLPSCKVRHESIFTSFLRMNVAKFSAKTFERSMNVAKFSAKTFERWYYCPAFDIYEMMSFVREVRIAMIDKCF